MADVVLADLDKAVKLVETAMKTDAKNAKLREQQRAKAEAALEAFKDNYAKSGREGNATKKQILTDLEKAVGIAENELDEDHPLIAKLRELITKGKQVSYEPDYTELDKTIHALENWDVKLEKTDQPKLAIKLIGTTKTAIDSEIKTRDKTIEEWLSLSKAARKDLEDVDDPDVKKVLTEILKGELL
jgi:hypothetical protein